MATECFQCHEPFSYWRNPSQECSKVHHGCGNFFCAKCLNYACVTEEEGKELGIKAPIHSFCQHCFQLNCNLPSFSLKYTEFGPARGEAPAIVFIHGGGGCRKMFEVHAKQLSSTHSFRCILIDLPGHGSRMNEILTLQSAFEVIQHAAMELAGNYQEIPPIAIGGSLGGYILMEFVGKFPTTFSGMIITMCGQNVGLNRSYLASMGLTVLSFVSSWLSSKTMLGLLVTEANKNAQLDQEIILESSLRCGMFFHQSEAQITILRESNPIVSLPAFPKKILFINGSKDHRDSEQIWLKYCQQGQLKVYEGGDHFFSHDKRFIALFLQDIEQFTKEIFTI